MKPLDRLRQEYKIVKNSESIGTKFTENYRDEYNAIRLFCLDCELVSFNDIEVMESEVNSSFSS